MDPTLKRILKIIDAALNSRSDVVELRSDDFVDVPPGLIAVRQLTLKNAAGRFVIRRSTDEMADGFGWLAEITLDPKDGELSHFLLQRDGSLVEAYGKNLFATDAADAEALANELENLLAQ